MRKFILVPGILSLLLAVSCGSDSGGGGNNGGGGFGSGGSNGFSTASLNGQYAYQISGFDYASSANLPFREAGVFTADGNGNITSARDDFAEGTSLVSDPATGTYDIASDGTGSITLVFSNNVFVTFAVSMVSSSKLLLTVPTISPAGLPTGAGVALKQDTSALSTTPSGNFAFGLHTVSNTQGSAAAVGEFAVSGGVITAGNEDVLQAGALSSHTLTGLFNAPDTDGRGTATLTNELSASSTFNYYIVNANTIFLFSTTSTGATNGIGRAEKQSTSTFSDASLSGNYAFGTHGDTSSIDSISTVGRFTADGAGNISAGALDSVQDGTVTSNLGFTGTYTVAANGRAAMTLTPTSGSAFTDVAYLVSPTRAFFLVSDPGNVEDGTIDAQQVTTFSNSSLNGTFAFATDGFTSDGSFDPFNRIGTMTADGTGGLELDYAVLEPNLNPSFNHLTGTYSVASNGRTTAGVTTPTAVNFVFYPISGSDGYILQVDTGSQTSGSFSKQQ